MDWVFLAFLHWAMAILTAVAAQRKGRSGYGFFFYGLLIWPVALVHALLAPPLARPSLRADEASRVECPHCAEFIKPKAKVCPFCRREVTPAWLDERERTSAPPSDVGSMSPSEVAAAPGGRDGEAANGAGRIEARTPRVGRLRIAGLLLLLGATAALAALWDRTESVRQKPVAESQVHTPEKPPQSESRTATGFSTETICKSGIATRMGRDPSIIAIDELRDGVVFLSYARPEDGTLWSYKCKLDGNRIIWGSKEGRWRTRLMDSTLLYVVQGDTIQVEDHFTDGIYKRRFDASQLW